jgi:hypothetical protein
MFAEGIADLGGKESRMRKLGFVTATVLAAAVATFASSVPARASDYPWCAQGRSLGYPGECSYWTHAQCMASVSGRNLSCGINPRTALARERRGRGVYREPYPQW